MKKERNQYFETYNHVILWNTAKLNLESACESEKSKMEYSLAAMLLFFFAFEGYLNWLGSRLAQETSPFKVI